MARPPAAPGAPFFRSRLQAQLLARLVEATDGATARELAPSGASPQAVHVELVRLADAGFVEVDRSRHAHVYRLAERPPVSDALRTLVRATVGVEPSLRRALAAVDGVTAAAIFGSWARGAATPESDIDVLVLGDASPDAVDDACAPVGRDAGRDVQVLVFPVADARARLAQGAGLFRGVLDAPLIDLIGDVRGELAP